MEWLTYATPLGLLLDIAGFLLVILFGHAIFQRTGSRVPPPSEGREGDVFHLVSDGNGDVDGNYRTRLRRAWFGVGLVISGFTLQILGSFVPNLTN
jgi:hypothetical protein